MTAQEARALGISSKQAFAYRDAYRAVLNDAAKGTNPTALGREVLLNRVGQLLEGLGL